MRWLALLTAWPLVLGSVVRRVEPNGAVRPMVTLEVNTCEDQRSSSTCRYEKDDGEKRIAVYTYVTGAYEEVRDFKVPCVPPGVDAFFLIDDETRRAAKPSNLEHWRRQGWWVLTMLPQIEATPEVPLARLAAKSLKFAPPSWLLNGTWDWLVEFDGDISVDLGGLRALVDEHSDKPLLLLKWYWRQCAPWDCFVQECDDMLTKRRDYVKTSYEKVVKWKEELTKYHNDPLKPFLPADYYELGIIFRQVSHPRALDVEIAFRQVLEQCRSIQRDQFLVPFYLWNASLDKEVVALSIEKLYSQLQYCVVATRQGRNLLTEQSPERPERHQAAAGADLDQSSQISSVVVDSLSPIEASASPSRGTDAATP
ncbi:unnamed protein product [Durusdinium trenchii]|uniref:Uncharacterized protein n=1 Tax=Durusdinium trenchii TaxID=1381693 RepID=A0ABP0HGC2_9DINO